MKISAQLTDEIKMAQPINRTPSPPPPQKKRGRPPNSPKAGPSQGGTSASNHPSKRSKGKDREPVVSEEITEETINVLRANFVGVVIRRNDAVREPARVE